MNDEHTARETLSARLKEAREYRGFSQEEIARYLDVPQTAVSLMENGSRRVETLELRRLANLYQTSMESLTGLDQETAEPETVRLVARAAADLSANDRDEVMRFVQYLQAWQSDDQTQRNPADDQ